MEVDFELELEPKGGQERKLAREGNVWSVGDTNEMNCSGSNGIHIDEESCRVDLQVDIFEHASFGRKEKSELRHTPGAVNHARTPRHGINLQVQQRSCKCFPSTQPSSVISFAQVAPSVTHPIEETS